MSRGGRPRAPAAARAAEQKTHDARLYPGGFHDVPKVDVLAALAVLFDDLGRSPGLYFASISHDGSCPCVGGAPYPAACQCERVNVSLDPYVEPEARS